MFFEVAIVVLTTAKKVTEWHQRQFTAVQKKEKPVKPSSSIRNFFLCRADRAHECIKEIKTSRLRDLEHWELLQMSLVQFILSTVNLLINEYVLSTISRFFFFDKKTLVSEVCILVSREGSPICRRQKDAWNHYHVSISYWFDYKFGFGDYI